MNVGKSSRRGCLITLEGIEGVGKSTSLDFVADQLRQAGKDVVVTREPGGVPVAERIRGLILSAEGSPPTPMTELLLMFAARSAHLEQLIWPALDLGRWVVCDRFTDASYAYQGGGRGMPEAEVHALETLVQRGFRPHLTLLLDADWQVTRSRRDSRGISDRFEKENRDFFDRVRAVYLERACKEPERFRVIDAGGTVEQVHARIATVLANFISTI